MPLAQDRPYQIRTASSSDVLVRATFLHLFDESVVWLTSRGLSSQWGSEPLKNDPVHIKKVEKIIEQCTVLLATPVKTEVSSSGPAVLGICLFSSSHRSHPKVIPPASEPEYYIQLLLTSRSSPSTKGLGSAFVTEVDRIARERGIGLIRLDCYAGGEKGEEGLVRVYERMGFQKAGGLLNYYESGWLGQVMERKVDVRRG
ncbi:MAG: hypothetical protein L6R38_007493 [Xanthoria sp. 2 TBL-2021]|nr:MAG: hypothetical protein L6R38_007493 [Xanthoria sp. 2 TBL-2021]